MKTTTAVRGPTSSVCPRTTAKATRSVRNVATAEAAPTKAMKADPNAKEMRHDSK
jgi:hypothetical protein